MDILDRGTVFLLHGWACPTEYWEPLQQQLRALGHRSTAITLPGYGPQAPMRPGFNWTTEAVAEQLAGQFATAHPGPVHLVGHSLGGSIAATIAARQPELAASVTLLGMAPTAPSASARAVLTALFLNGPINDSAIEQCLYAWYGQRLPEDRSMLRRPFRIDRPVLEASLLAALDGVADDVPPLIDAPLQILTGTEDTTRPRSELEAYVRAHPGTVLSVAGGAGHMVHWDEPRWCARRIAALITGE